MKVEQITTQIPEYLTLGSFFGSVIESNSVSLPTSGNQAPFYLPILLPFNITLKGILVLGGAVVPADTGVARLKLWIHAANADRTVGPVLKSADTFGIAGTGNVRDATDSTIANIGSGAQWFARCQFSAPISIASGALYFLGGMWEGAFDGTTPGQISSVTRFGFVQMRKNSATQAFSFVPSANPTTTIEASGDTILRPYVALWTQQL